MKLGLGISDEGITIPTGDPELLMLAEHVIEQLNSICKINLPYFFNYPRFFKAIRIFVERGNVNKVKEISRRIDENLIDDL